MAWGKEIFKCKIGLPALLERHTLLKPWTSELPRVIFRTLMYSKNCTSTFSLNFPGWCNRAHDSLPVSVYYRVCTHRCQRDVHNVKPHWCQVPCWVLLLRWKTSCLSNICHGPKITFRGKDQTLWKKMIHMPDLYLANSLDMNKERITFGLSW